MTSSYASEEAVSSQIVQSALHFTRNRLKVAVVGEKRSGKSALLRRFVWNVFDDQVESSEPRQVVQRQIQGRQYKLELVEIDAESLFIDDSVDEEERKRLRNASNPLAEEWIDMNAVLILYDTTQECSFDKAVDYMRIITRLVPPICEICFVGTKCDMKESRKVSFQHADALAERMSLSLFEVSSKTSINCLVCLDEVAERLAERRYHHVESFVSETVYPSDDHSSSSTSPQPPSTVPIQGSILPSILCFKWWSH